MGSGVRGLFALLNRVGERHRRDFRRYWDEERADRWWVEGGKPQLSTKQMVSSQTHGAFSGALNSRRRPNNDTKNGSSITQNPKP